MPCCCRDARAYLPISHGAAGVDHSVPFSGQIVDGVMTSFEDLTPDDTYKLEVGETYIFEILLTDMVGELAPTFIVHLIILP